MFHVFHKHNLEKHVIFKKVGSRLPDMHSNVLINEELMNKETNCHLPFHKKKRVGKTIFMFKYLVPVIIYTIQVSVRYVKQQMRDNEFITHAESLQHVPTPANKEQAVVIGTALYNPENLHLMASIVWHVIQYVIGN